MNSIDVLLDDVLLEIFNFYVDDPSDDGYQPFILLTYDGKRTRLLK